MSFSPVEQFPFVDLHLAQRLERAEGRANANFVESRAQLFPQSNAMWIEVAGAFAMFDTPNSPLTQTFGLGVFDKVTSVELDQLEKFFRDRHATVYHEVSPLADISLFALLHQRGYEAFEFTSVMYRPIAKDFSLGKTLDKKLTVRPVRDDEAELSARVSAQGWSEFGELSDFMLEIGQISAHRADTINFFAEWEGEPIATGTLCLSEGIALLGGACTIPQARKRGAQSALLETRLRYAAEQGYDLAMMCAQPGSASQRNAERNGFRIAYTRIKWRLQ